MYEHIEAKLYRDLRSAQKHLNKFSETQSFSKMNTIFDSAQEAISAHRKITIYYIYILDELENLIGFCNECQGDFDDDISYSEAESSESTETEEALIKTQVSAQSKFFDSNRNKNPTVSSLAAALKRSIEEKERKYPSRPEKTK